MKIVQRNKQNEKPCQNVNDRMNEKEKRFFFSRSQWAMFLDWTRKIFLSLLPFFFPPGTIIISCLLM